MALSPEAATHAEKPVRGVLFALAMGIPALAGILFDAFPLISPGAFGAMFALFIDPRRGRLLRVLAIGTGGVLVVLSAAFGIAIQGHHNLALVFLYVLSWLSALPRPEHAYLGLVIKYAASAVLLTSFGFHATPAFAAAFLGGMGLGIGLSLAGRAYIGDADKGPLPLDEFRAVLHGDTNGRLFGVAVPVTVLVSTLVAQYLSFSDPAWVGLTVLYVMHSNGATELQHIRDRTLGTLFGVVASAALLYSTVNPYVIALGVGLSAFAMPFVIKDHYLLFSFVITCAVLLLIDMSMFLAGGDFALLRWRLIDTVIACAWVLASNLTVRLIRKMREKRGDGGDGKAGGSASS